MAEIVYRGFTGEQPRLEPNLLPDAAAQYALNCEFDSGALAPTRAGALLATLDSNPVRGLYTADGINFFSWPVEAQAFASPVIEDQYNRMYFLLPGEGVLRAGLTAEMALSGPTPATTFRLGVPQPTLAPVPALIDRTTLPEYPGATVTAEAWWDDNGTQLARAALALAEITPFRLYTFAPPVRGVGVPASALLSAKLLLKDAAGAILASVTLMAGDSASSNGLPGGLEVTLNAAGTLAIAWGVTETRAYTYTYENTWGEQGAPAPPATIAPTYLQDVQLTVALEAFAGYRPLSKVRIYRTYGSSAAYIETEVAGSGLVYLDASRSPSSVLGALESLDWFAPPTGLQGWCASPNGWFAAFKGNTLHLSEPYQPHAWPYIQKFPHAIRGIHPTKQALVVTTAGGVYLLIGTNPVGTSQFALSLPQAGISQRSMTEIDGAVAYASHDGFALVAGQDATMAASQKLFTRTTWRAQYGDILDDASLRLAYHDGCLIATSSTQAKGFALRLDEDVGAYSRTNTRMDLTLALPVNDALYYTVGNQLFQFRGGGPQAFDWHGKTFVFPSPQAFGVGFLWADGPVLLTLYADGVPVFSDTINDGYFTLPDINAQLRWSVRLQGSSRVRGLHLARTFKGLKRA